jgi:hypothetical protein
MRTINFRHPALSTAQLSAQEWFEQKIPGKWICWLETGARRIGNFLFSNFLFQWIFLYFLLKPFLCALLCYILLSFTFLCAILSLLCLLLLLLLIKFLLIRMLDDKYTNGIPGIVLFVVVFIH